MNNVQLLLLCISSCALGVVCRRQIFNPDCHGFYRFFAFIGILYLLIKNIGQSPIDLFTPKQLFVALVLCSSLFCVVAALQQLHRWGGRERRTNRPDYFAFENTEKLVTGGIYRYIRHPMYTSLLLLDLGLFLLQPGWFSSIVAAGVGAMLYVTARVEEGENLEFFGELYIDYQRRSKMFIPFLL